MMHTADFTSDALKQVKSLPKATRNSLKKEFRQTLLRDPGGCSEELVMDPLKGFRSFHWGEYRVVFQLCEEIKRITVVAVAKKSGHADSDVYKKLEDLARSGKLAEAILTTMKLLPKP